MANTRTRTHDARLTVPKPRSYDRSLNPIFVRCFGEGHPWDRRTHPNPEKAGSGFYRYWFCLRCGADRTFWRNWAGQTIQRWYTHPQGYETVTHLTRAEANVWLELYDREQDAKANMREKNAVSKLKKKVS